WALDQRGGTSGEKHCQLRLVAGESQEVSGSWHLAATRSLPSDHRTPDSTFLIAQRHVEDHQEPQVTSTWLLEPVSNVEEPSPPTVIGEGLAVKRSAASSTGLRFYEVVVRNLTARRFELQGSKLPAIRNAVEGRFTRLTGELSPEGTHAGLPRSVGPVVAPDPESHPSPTAQATFSSCAVLGDLLEFTVSYHDGKGEGFTVRVHAHSNSPLRSGVCANALELDVTSATQEVPRLVARPPTGYAETALGVYSSPGRVEALKVGELKPETEVLAGIGPRQGRWLKITAPLEGWIQAETRDGRAIVHELKGQRPNLRQVVTLRPVHGRTAPAMSPALKDQEAALRDATSPISHSGPAGDSDDVQKRAAEGAYFSVRAAEAERLLRERARIEATGIKGARPRQRVLGVF
ncbi:unnamed protein product, partial [Polarella glacialis]